MREGHLFRYDDDSDDPAVIKTQLTNFHMPILRAFQHTSGEILSLADLLAGWGSVEEWMTFLFDGFNHPVVH